MTGRSANCSAFRRRARPWIRPSRGAPTRSIMASSCPSAWSTPPRSWPCGATPQLRRGRGRVRHGAGRRPVGGVGEPDAARAAAGAGGRHRPVHAAAGGRRAAAADRVYFLGATPDVLARMLERGRAAGSPGCRSPARTTGTTRPARRPRSPRTSARCRTDLLFVGMSSPRKETVPGRVGDGHQGAASCTGSAARSTSSPGVTRRAPLWYQEHGLEWLYRALAGTGPARPPVPDHELCRSSPWSGGRCCAATRQESSA